MAFSNPAVEVTVFFSTKTAMSVSWEIGFKCGDPAAIATAAT